MSVSTTTESAESTTKSQPAAIRHGFELLRERAIPEINTRARLYRHVKTGAELLSLENDDENKVFGVAFRTPVADSTGVPHILEHSVLCGSRKYPVKEPFNELAKGSLKTFLNAMTYPDKTVYPVASTNLQDFYNLADVYLDAVFYPRITEDTFLQEAWRYEPVDIERPVGVTASGTAGGTAEGIAEGKATGRADGTLVYRGVVHGEMKGAYASPERVLYRATMASLFPDTTYRHESGGHPRHITDLTYEQFRAFHRAYYHPSNARIFFYGDDDPERRLQFVDEYLREFERAPADSAIASQPRFAEPRRVTETYGIGPETPAAKKAFLTVNWMLGETPNAKEAIALEILETILIGTPASPLRKALIDSGLGESLAGGGLGAYRQWVFGTGLKGIAAEDADKVEALVLRVLRELAEQGIEREMVEAAVNTVEFALRENNTGAYPRGLALSLRALNTWLYDGDPFEPLAFEAPLEAIKQELAGGSRLFEDMIRRYFLENTHRTTVLLKPDPELNAREEAAERARLAQAHAGMDEAALQALAERARALKRAQETPDPPELLALLPRLTLADLDRQNKLIPLDVSQRHGARVLYHDLFTNGIVYLDLGLDLRALPQELLPYARLFGRALLQMGTHKEDFVKLTQRIGRKTGGIRPDLHCTSIHGLDASSTWLFLRGKALASQAGDLLDILRDVLLEVKLDNQERFRQLVREDKARQESAVVPNGHAIVATRLSSRFKESGWVGEQTHGISNLLFVRQLVQRVENDWSSVLAKLERIRELLLDRTSATCNVTLDAANWERVEPLLDQFLESLPAARIERPAWSPATSDRAEAMVIPGQINYVGKAANLYAYGYAYHGSAEVITHYLQRTWLWDQIRVRGGAYGAFGSFNNRSGVFAYLSYRDPNVLPTLERYDQTPDYLRKLDLSQDELTKAIIGAISRIDAYLLPDAKGWASMDRYLAGETDEMRQRMRDEVLGTTAADFRAFAGVLEHVRTHGQVAILGSEFTIEAVNKERPGWLEVWHVGL